MSYPRPVLLIAMIALWVHSAAAPAADGGAASPNDLRDDSTAKARAADTNQPKKPDASGLWADFNHYVLVARPDLAAAAAAALMAEVDNAHLLSVVERGDYRNWPKTIREVGGQNEILRSLAQQLAQRIQSARTARSRDKDRIAGDIELLAGTLRQRHNAIERLRAAGQFSAPQLLAVLLNQDQASLHPHVETAMVAIGRPLVYPLSVTVSQLEPVQMGQIAQALAHIGYPRAMPYLKEVLEDTGTDPNTRIVVQTAYNALAEQVNLTEEVSASELFFTLGKNYFRAGTKGERLPGYDSATDRGIAWTYSPESGLVHIPVPAAIFPDVLAMRAARRALRLDTQMDPALSLWVAANLRRENRLPAGEDDPSYRAPRGPMYYASLAGPLRLHDVLDEALKDQDTDLALDAIAALQDTAGTDALISRQGAVQPLLRALSYPDRRVRFPAAFVMTQTRPDSEFPGSHRVVTVLAEAVRQSDLRHGLVIASDQQMLNGLMADLNDLGYEVTGGLSLDAVTDAINTGPGFDVVVISADAERVKSIYHQTSENYKLAAAPILAIVSAGDKNKLTLAFGDDSHLLTVVSSTDPGQLRPVIEQAAAAAAGGPISRDQAAEYASIALSMLRSIALGNNSVYDVSDAEPALIQALDDQRETIVKQAGRVLERIDSQAAQMAIADAALDEQRSLDVIIVLLNSLAESAKHFGNKLGEIQLRKLLDLVNTAEGELALTAARAHGALTLPTGNVVNMIIQ